MWKKTLSRTILALAFVGGIASTAAAQNPFAIDHIITDADNSGVPTAVKKTDPAGSAKELGPINASTTKVGGIHSAPVPMLGLTNPNGQVDLNAIWTQTKTVGTDVWFYFAWSRDSSNGSGFISIEIQKNPADAACAYDTATANQLIASCNPWKNRTAGDFILLWDQQGGSRDIYIRTFSGTAPNLTLGDPELLTSNVAVAEYSADGFRGEAAVNLTEAGIFTPGTCSSFANTIPGTVTGNSDTADYKDAVLALFPPVSNCGTVRIQKATSPAGQSGSFPYTLSRTGGNVFLGSADSDCSTSGSSQATCASTLTSDGDFDVIDGLVAGTDFSLTEGTLASGWSQVSIVCIFDSDTANPYTGTNFKVGVSETTTCTINNLLQGTPTAATVQGHTVRLTDSITVSGILRAAGETALTVTFRLYSDNACATEVGSATEKAANAGIALTLASGSATTGSAQTGSSILVTNGTYHWKVTFSGNNYNAGFTTSCSGEVTTVSLTDTGSGS
jgi:hypothetical protein